MAEITQRLGFEATQAIASIASLNKALSGLNARLLAFNKRANATAPTKVIQGFAQVQQEAVKAESSVRETGKALENTGKSGSKAGRDITISWETMIRVIQTQIIVRTLAELTRLFNESAKAAGEFELSIGRIAAIAQGSSGEFDALSKSIRDIAIDIGRPIEEVTEAAFEALQNDLGSTEQTLRFVQGAAQDLSLITGGELVESVNAVSSVLKIFNLDLEDAERVTSVLFGTIDAGRVTLTDLANSLGTVGPLARALGIEFEEMAASIAAITLQGTDSARAQTQLRGVFNALLKPTTELKKAFDELGVESGAELIEVFGGLTGALQALEKVAGDNAQQFAAFFGRIRGQQGALNILNDDAANVVRIMEELSGNTTRAREEAEKLDQLTVRNLDREIAKLNDSILALGFTTQNIKLGATAFINVMLLGLRAITVGFNDTHDAAKRMRETIQDDFGTLKDNAAEFNEENNKLIDSRVRAELSGMKEIVSGVSGEYARLRKLVTAEQTKITNGVSFATDTFLSGMSNLVSEVENRLRGLGGVIDSLQGRAQSAAQELLDIQFEKQLASLTQQQRVTERINRLEEARVELREAAAAVTADPATVERLAQAEAEVRKRANESVQEAQRSGSRFNIRTAEEESIKSLKLIEKENINAANRLAKLNKTLDDRRSGNLVADLKELIELREKQAKLDPTSAESKALEQRIQQLAAGIDTNLLGDLGLADAFESAFASLKESLDNARFEWKGATDSLKAVLREDTFIAQVRLQLEQGTGDLALDEAFKNVLEAGRPDVALERLTSSLIKFQQDQAGIQREIELRTGAIKTNYDGIEQRLNNISKLGIQTPEFFEILQGAEALRAEILRAGPDEQEDLAGRVNEFVEKVDSLDGINFEGSKVLGEVAAILGDLLTNTAARDTLLGELNPETLEGTKTIIEAISQNAADITTGLKDAGTETGTLGNTFIDAAGKARTISPGVQTAIPTLNAAIQRAQTLEQALLAAARAAASIGLGGSFLYHGGKVGYRAVGGPINRGADTIPTMLSPGEFVVNSKQARNFAAELQAINAGQAPQFREQGGSVTNIGDINVSVQTDSTRGVSGRDIAAALRRELRRETSIL